VLHLSCGHYSDWLHILKDEFIREDEIKNRRRITRGEVLHYALSFIRNLNGQDARKVFADAIEMTEQKYRNYDAMEDIKKTVRRIINAPQLKPFFYVDKAAVFTEKEVVDCLGNTYRIDRLIVGDKEIVVVDYKSSADKAEAYEEQLRRYMELLQPVYGARVYKGFLVYLDTMECRQV
jgi:ATP-dependent exoDNAse (exonuclease V) beta subunit